MKNIIVAMILFLPLSVISDPYRVTIKPHLIELNKLIHKESSGNVNAFSKVGAIGLMQITTNCLSHYNWVERKQVRPSELFNPQTNIRVGRWYMNYLERHFKYLPEPERTVVRISAYNLGQYRVKYKELENEYWFLIYRPYVHKINPARLMEFKNKHKLLYKGKKVDLWSVKK